MGDDFHLDMDKDNYASDVITNQALCVLNNVLVYHQLNAFSLDALLPVSNSLIMRIGVTCSVELL